MKFGITESRIKSIRTRAEKVLEMISELLEKEESAVCFNYQRKKYFSSSCLMLGDIIKITKGEYIKDIKTRLWKNIMEKKVDEKSGELVKNNDNK